MFETFDHTADLGLRVSAADETSLFVEAARALTSILVENPEDVAPTQTERLTISGEAVDYLLFDWLSELLYRYETTQFLGTEFEVARTPEGLNATVRGEHVDRARHHLSHEVKAITYHGLEVRRTDQGWEAELIVDI